MKSLPGGTFTIPEDGPRRLVQGESVFVPHDAGNLELSGAGHAVCAWVP